MYRIRRTAAAATIAACTVTALPSVARAVIQVQRGISGITIGMTQTRVTESLGAPHVTVTGRNDFGPYAQFLYPGGITVTFQGTTIAPATDNVTAVAISGRTDRTARGIGVGSTIAAVRHNVRRVGCRTFAGFTDCTVGQLVPDMLVTDFMIKHGRVSRVTIGIVFA